MLPSGSRQRADVADRRRHLGGRPRQATLGFAALGDRVDLGSTGDFDADVGERRHDRLRALVVIADEADEHEDERLVDLIAMAEPGTLAVGVFAAIEQLERRDIARTTRWSCRCRWHGRAMCVQRIDGGCTAYLSATSLTGPALRYNGIGATLGPQDQRVAPRVQERTVEPVELGPVVVAPQLGRRRD